MPNIVVLSIPIFFLLIGAEWVWDFARERKRGRKHYRLNDALTNISCGIIDQLSAVGVKVFTVGAYAWVYDWVQSLGGWSLEANAFNMVLCFVLVDLLYYWAHRISHEVNFFWIGHVVHHQSEDYNLSVALRQGALQKVFLFWIYLPLALLGFPTEWFVMSSVIGLLYQFWIHTEAVDKMGWFGTVFNTPSHHRVHHGRNPRYIDKNHAGVFIIWDKWFGTFQVEEERPLYGITEPTQTFNPVWAHVQPAVRLWREVQSTPSWCNKFLLLVKPPGWSEKGVKAPPPIRGDEVKFDRKLGVEGNAYILAHYLLLLSLTTFFLFNLGRFDGLEKTLFIAYMLFYVASLGMLFDGKKYGLAFDFTRGLFGLLWGFFLILNSQPLSPFQILLVVSGILSGLGLLLRRKIKL